MTAPGTQLEALNAELDGELVLPDDDRFDAARAAWNLAVDQRPAAVVYAETVADVARTLRAAAATGLQVAPQGTGHGVAARGDIAGAILLRTERMNAVSIDADARIGRFEAGVIWRDALTPAGEHGLAGPSGSSPDVGVAGYITGGGFGWLGRRYGLACNQVAALEVVTADGEARRVDAGSDPDLFWALRGGGGSHAVITAVEVELVELGQVFAGTIVLPADERTPEIVHAYAEWAASAPDEITSIVRFLQLPPMEEIPEPLRARPLLTIGACYAGAVDQGERLITPLRDLGEPILDTTGPMPASQLVSVHMDPEQPVPGLTHHSLLRELPPAALDAFIAIAGPESGSPLTVAELRQAGGALAEAPEGAGALSHIDAAFVFNGVGALIEPLMVPAIGGRLDAIAAALEPWSTGRSYANFSERPTAAEKLYDAETLERLRAIKAERDPDDLIRGSQILATG